MVVCAVHCEHDLRLTQRMVLYLDAVLKNVIGKWKKLDGGVCFWHFFFFAFFLFLAGFGFWLVAPGLWLLALASGFWLLLAFGFWPRASGFCGFWLGCNSAGIFFIVCVDLL